MSSIFTHLTGCEKTLLSNLAKQLPRESTIVEIGSYLGASTCYLASGARLRDGKVYAVDTWTNLAMSEGARDSYNDFLQNTALFKDWIVPLRGLSTAIARELQVEIDLLFVDGDHSLEAVRADLRAWLPKVKDNGIVVLHDYDWAEGVRQAVREFIVPLQVEGGRRLHHTYWARIKPSQKQKHTAIAASVVVPTYGRPQSLRQTLQSLIQLEFPTERYEIIVVDNKVSGETRRVTEDLDHRETLRIEVVDEPKVGLHNARHAGAQKASGEILVYVDDDVTVHPQWLDEILAPFQDPEVAVVGGKIIPKWEVEPPKWLSQFPQSYLSLLDLGEKREVLRWPATVYGSNMAVRRTALYEVGGFHPDAMGDRHYQWFRGDGETGLQRKLHEVGLKVVYEPRAYLWHRIPQGRLQAKAFYHRGLMVGLSMSYSHIRNARGKRLFYVRILIYSCLAFVRMVLNCMKAVVQRSHRIRHISNMYRWYGYGMQHLLAVISPRLRGFLLRDCYLGTSRD